MGQSLAAKMSTTTRTPGPASCRIGRPCKSSPACCAMPAPHGTKELEMARKQASLRKPLKKLFKLLNLFLGSPCAVTGVKIQGFQCTPKLTLRWCWVSGNSLREYLKDFPITFQQSKIVRIH